VRLPDLKLVEYPTRDQGWITELFDLAADPGETRNLAARRPDDARRLHLLLEAWRARGRSDAQADEITDPAVRDALRELGYLD
jgi:hypothetical protein